MVSDLPRRSVQELISLYSVEPTLVDIYVEGRSDRVLLEFILNGSAIQIYEIDTIDIPAAELQKLGLTTGERNEVIALGIALESQLPDSTEHQIRCVIDADLDRALKIRTLQSRYQLMTDFSCLESYWYSAPQLAKYKLLGLHDPHRLSEVDIYAVLAPIIRECFLLRAAAAKVGIQLKWLNPVTCCSRSGVNVEFDRDEFITRLLNKNSALGRRTELVDVCEQLREQLIEDPRHYVHKDDYLELLSWYVRPYIRGSALSNVDVVYRMLACCVERADLAVFPLFAELSALTA